MSSFVPPWDEAAERTVIGAALATCRGAHLARSRLTAADFYKPAHARLFGVLDQIEHLIDVERRAAAGAELAMVEPKLVVELIDQRAVMWDLAGSYAHRVTAMSQRRRLMAGASDVVKRLAAGESIDSIAEQLHALGAAV